MIRQVMGLALCLALLGMCPAHVAWGKDLTGNSNIQLVRDLYNNVRDTLPSEVNAVENTQAIQHRLKCYEEIHDYGQRIQICNNKYVKSIVHNALNIALVIPHFHLCLEYVFAHHFLFFSY